MRIQFIKKLNCCACIKGAPNKTAKEPASYENMLGLIDYKLANSDHNQTHHCSRWGMAAKRLQGKGILKGENHKAGWHKPWCFRSG